ncbi:MAG: transposase family protein [Paracoccaceae bacterium]
MAASHQNLGYRRGDRKSKVTVTNLSAEEGTVTRASLREYAAIQRERYHAAPRAEKHCLLDEVVTVTGVHRKAAIRLLHRPPRAPTARPRAGRPRLYGPAVAAAAQVLWEATGRIGAPRLHPFVPELLDRLTQCGELALAPDLEKLLRQASPATLSRLLAPARAQLPSRGLSTTRPASWLKSQIPLRTFADWDETQPGFLEVDLVGHCGSSTQGFYLCTLCTVDVLTSWVELEAVWGKGQQRVGTAIHHIRTRLPMPLRGLDSDNGSEFINQRLYRWCQREGIRFTRSRAYKKNDSAHVEQKNGAIVRALIGYDRYASTGAYAQLRRLYTLMRLHVNFFQPVQKLVRKTRQGALVHRVYDRAQTPYQRLCATGGLTPATHRELEALYQNLNPLHLRRQIDGELKRLWALAAPDPHRNGGPEPAETMVTQTSDLQLRKGNPEL